MVKIHSHKKSQQMKKLTLAFITAFSLFLFTQSQLKADTENNTLKTGTTVPVKSAEAEARFVRLNEIKTTDRSMLNKLEKKELRTEARALKSEMKSNNESTTQSGNRGVYLSVGGIIIIILLLILIL